MPVPIWAGHYIGLPFKDHGRDGSGLDCWGLARLVLLEQFGIALPSYAHEYSRTTAIDHISALIERESRRWQNIDLGHERCGDVVVLRLHGKPMHVGLVLGDQHMLHIERGIDSVIERYTGPRWKDRIDSFYRYQSFSEYPFHDEKNTNPDTDDFFI